MQKSSKIAVAVIVIFLLASLAFLKSVVPALLQAAISSIQLQFPEVTWSTNPSLMIVVENNEGLNEAWNILAAARSGASMEGQFAEVGKLSLPSGELLATDLNFPEDNVPFRMRVPPGKYSVYESHQSESSFVAIVINDDQPVKWIIADSVNDTASTLESSEGIWGVSLDSSAILVDGLACQKQLSYKPSVFFDGTTKSQTIETSSGMNVVCVDLGGVGVFPAYWGLNADSEPVVLMIHTE